MSVPVTVFVKNKKKERLKRKGLRDSMRVPVTVFIKKEGTFEKRRVKGFHERSCNSIHKK